MYKLITNNSYANILQSLNILSTVFPTSLQADPDLTLILYVVPHELNIHECIVFAFIFSILMLHLYFKIVLHTRKYIFITKVLRCSSTYQSV